MAARAAKGVLFGGIPTSDPLDIPVVLGTPGRPNFFHVLLKMVDEKRNRPHIDPTLHILSEMGLEKGTGL